MKDTIVMSKINAVELYTENGITLYNVNGVVMTTTESIANKFGKTKSDVNRTLNNFPDISERFNSAKLLNSETVGNGSIKPIKTTYIDRDTMTLLVMGFTGGKAFEWQKQYIKAFNLMEAKLSQSQKLTFNERKMQMISDVAKKAIDSINAMEDDTKPIQALLPPTNTKALPEPSSSFREPVKAIPTIKPELKKFRNERIYSWNEIKWQTRIIKTFAIYSYSESIIQVRTVSGNILKFTKPRGKKWDKVLSGDFGKLIVRIKFFKGKKKSRIALLKVINKGEPCKDTSKSTESTSQ